MKIIETVRGKTTKSIIFATYCFYNFIFLALGMLFSWNMSVKLLNLVYQAETVFNLEFILYSILYRLVLSKF